MLNELSKSIFEANKLKGFWDDRLNVPIKMKESGLFSDEEIKSVEDATIGQILMLITSEVAETMEANRGRTNILNRGEFEKQLNYTEIDLGTDTCFKINFENNIKNSFEDELADVIIRVLDLCGAKDIDIDWHIEQKLRYNKLREHRHGKKY